MHLSGFLPAGSGRAGRARATARRSRAGRDSGRHADGPCDQRQHDRSDAARRIRSPDEADRASRHRATARPHRVGESAARTRAARQRFRGRAVGGPTAAAGRERRDARRAEAGRPRRDERRDRAPDRRDGHGQGGGRPRAACGIGPACGAVRRRELRGYPGRPARKRVVRASSRCVHGRACRSRGAARRGRRRHALSRRDRRHARRDAGEAAARAAGAR